MIEWVMMGAFVMALGLSLWKLYHFFPNKPLADDDTTARSVEELMELMVACIIELCDAQECLTPEALYEQMIAHPTFDNAHYWRFNQNRLNQLISRYYILNPAVTSLQQIYEAETLSTGTSAV